MLPSYLADCPAAWRVDELAADRGWIFELDDRARRDLIGAVRAVYPPDKKKLFDYRHDEFDFGSAWPVIERALAQVKHGRGIALVRGLPREGVSEQEFELMTWAIGLHTGVARPQGKATHYISAVRDAGADYRTGTGRGYSSNAELDYHTDYVRHRVPELLQPRGVRRHVDRRQLARGLSRDARGVSAARIDGCTSRSRSAARASRRPTKGRSS